MKSIAAIAWNTFREAVRSRILYLILVFALVLMGSSGIVRDLAIQSHSRVLRDFGLACINFFGLAVAILVGIGLVYNELDKKSIYTIVSKPISRWQFLLGKYFGLLLTIYVNILIMTVFFLSVLHYLESTTGEKWEKVLYVKDPSGQVVLVDNPTWAAAKYTVGSMGRAAALAAANVVGVRNTKMTGEILWVVLFTALEMAIITSFAVLYSSFSTPTLSAIFTVMTFIAGRLNHDIWYSAEKFARENMLAQDSAKAASGAVLWLNHLLPVASPPLFAHLSEWLRYWMTILACAIMPNLGAFKQSTLDMSGDVMFKSSATMWPTAPYAVAYSATVLVLSVLIFRRRNFK